MLVIFCSAAVLQRTNIFYEGHYFQVRQSRDAILVRQKLRCRVRNSDGVTVRDAAIRAAVALDRLVPKHRRGHQVHLHHRLVHPNQHQNAQVGPVQYYPYPIHLRRRVMAQSVEHPSKDLVWFNSDFLRWFETRSSIGAR